MLTEKNKLQNELSALQFMMWELHLYLDTHPHDASAKARLAKYRAAAAAKKAAYEEKYGPLDANGGCGSDWLRDPWPWDLEEGMC